VYKSWFYEHVIPLSDDGQSAALIVLPWTTGEPDYRDKYRDGPQRFTGIGFFFYNIGPYAQAPEIIIPGMASQSIISVIAATRRNTANREAVESTPYISKFTGYTEQLPAALGLVAAKGSDVMLADLVKDLFGRGLEERIAAEKGMIQKPFVT